MTNNKIARRRRRARCLGRVTMKLLVSLAVLTCCAGASILAVVPALAHSNHQRPRIGASHMTPSGAPEDWGTYCVTELAPLFRDAIALNGTLLASADAA